ncbi:MAG TPA: N-methyl-L-tryptophan oxidase [Longimicrobium sp.]|nr:N-methyl-L-tryptophan oxidase [Longimicrobium sp.]
MHTYDTIVLGLGGMGSAALAHLAARGRRVLGLEQFQPLHDRGSSHGRTRVIRQAYFEHPDYVPLILRAYALWEELERATGSTLLVRTGALLVGREDGVAVPGSSRSARAHGLAHDVLDASALRRRFPQLRPRDDEWGVYEQAGGVLLTEPCVLSHLRRAVEHGAEARFGARVAFWRSNGERVRVSTDGGEVEAGSLVITAGPWLGRATPELALPLEVERNVVHWFEPRGESAPLSAGALPVWLVERAGEPVWYGVPALRGDPSKLAIHHGKQLGTPETIERTVHPGEIEGARRFLSDWIPDAAGAHRASLVCLYTNTPDEHFVIGLHPAYGNVALAGGFSGHGFKFCSVVGEICADLATAGSTAHPIGLFDPKRFTERG